MRTTSQRPGITVLSLLLALGLTPACHKTHKLNLPEEPKGKAIAFATLSDDKGPTEVGPVVLSVALYSGRYTIETHDSKLKARLFFVPVDALILSADAACDALSARLERIACHDRVADCAREPTSCLSPRAGTGGCEDRLALSDSPSLQAFQEGEKGNFSSIPDPKQALAGLTLCGPSLAKSCPLLLPGFRVSEGGAFRCLASSVQRACSLEVDLAGCGLGGASGEVKPDGSFQPKIESEGCSTAPAEGSMDGAFAVICGGRRFTATLLDEPFGESGCTRKGPTVYNDGSATPRNEDWSTRGALRALKWTHFPGWPARLLFDGTGIDGCACARNDSTEGCTIGCGRQCDEFVTLPDCANVNAPHACREVDAYDGCRSRCRTACERKLMYNQCLELYSGHQLQLADAAEPERGLAGTGLGTEDPVRGSGSLALLERDGMEVVAVALETQLRFYGTMTPDALSEVPGSRVGLSSLRAAGLAAVPARRDTVVVFGRTLAANVTGAVMVVRVSSSAPVTVEKLRTANLPLPTADAATVAGRDGDRVLAISISPPIGATSPAVGRVAVWPLDTGNPTAVDIDGRPTAIGSLEGGAAVVGIVRPTGASVVAVLEPSDASFAVSLLLDIPTGLVPVTFLADPLACATGTCRTYVGLEQTAASEDSGNALVGVIEYPAGSPRLARVKDSFVLISSPELSFLELDPESDTLYAVSSEANDITPITLLR